MFWNFLVSLTLQERVLERAFACWKFWKLKMQPPTLLLFLYLPQSSFDLSMQNSQQNPLPRRKKHPTKRQMKKILILGSPKDVKLNCHSYWYVLTFLIIFDAVTSRPSDEGVVTRRLTVLNKFDTNEPKILVLNQYALPILSMIK